MADDCANPLLLKWLGEWLETARHQNSKGVTTYRKAYDSMKACPLTFAHPSEAVQLHGLGPKLCQRLTDKLEAHCLENGLPIPKAPHQGNKRSAEAGDLGPAKKPRKTKPYVPTYRSGPYALLYGLSTVGDEMCAGMTKSELITAAQPYCDSSFTAPSDLNSFYTAWSSMKTLLNKDLVYERGRPLRRYALTEDGWEVAKGLRAAAGDKVDNRREPSTGSRHEEPTRQLLPAKTTFQENSGFNGHSRQQSSTKLPQMIGRIDGGDSSSTSRPKVTLRRRNVETEGDFGFLEILSSSPTGRPTEISSSRRDAEDYTNTRLQLADMVSDRPQSPEWNVSSLTEDSPQFPEFAPIVLQPGTFSVQLVLDNREVRAKDDRDYFQEQLITKGVKPITRAMELGDATWVAKCHDQTMLNRFGEETDEIVLDWIVERKRLDDLIGSIKDGRFHEQKFRLRKTGLKNIIYIIEEISLTSEVASKYMEAVESAIASTQVVNGYFVKKTQGLDDTIRYLARMTMLLKSVYESQPLHVVPTRLLTPQNHLPLLQHLGQKIPSKSFHITYPAFSSLASKSDFLTLRDVFLKMLMCTRGVTGDKALEIQKRWRTPREFVEALAACGPGESGKLKRKNLLSDQMGTLVGRKKIGKALSAKVADVWSVV